VIVFAEELCENILKYVPHRQGVLSIPKRLRIYFMFDRSLLSKLSQCAWKVLSQYLRQAVPYEDAVPGAVIAIQSFGDFLNFNPHLHIIATDGCFYGGGSFMVCPTPDGKALEELFRYEVFKKCQGRMRVISFTEDPEVIKKILKHLGLWLVKPKPPPRANGPPVGHHIDYADTQFPSYDDYNVD